MVAIKRKRFFLVSPDYLMEMLSGKPPLKCEQTACKTGQFRFGMAKRERESGRNVCIEVASKKSFTTPEKVFKP